MVGFRHSLKKNWSGLFSLLTLMVVAIAMSCSPSPPKDSRAAQAETGKKHYDQYCASCHGPDGKGVKIDSLDRMPKDLTTIKARRRSGEFPILEVARQIDGRQMSSFHGTRQMPVWGEVFSEEEYLSEAQIKGKLSEIIAFLMSIQE